MSESLPRERKPTAEGIEPAKGGRPSRAFAWSIRVLRFLIVPALVVAAFAAWLYLPGVSSLPDSGVNALLPANTSAAQSEAEASHLFGSSLLPRIAVVQRNPRGLTIAQQRRIVSLAVRLDRRLSGMWHADSKEPELRRRIVSRCGIDITPDLLGRRVDHKPIRYFRAIVVLAGEIEEEKENQHGKDTAAQ